MEEVVRRANFFNPTEEDAETYERAIDDDRYEELNAAQINRVLDALAERLKSDKWPQRKGKGLRMYNMTCSHLRNCAR